MNRTILLVAALLAIAPAALAHKPPGPITHCQPYTGEAYHDYIPLNQGNLVIGGDGNLEDCDPINQNNWTVGPMLSDRGSTCQILKHVRDNNTLPQGVRDAASAAHTALCTEIDTGVPQTAFDYDGELDYGHGGVFLAVDTGDGVTWGSYACIGMTGHHSANIYAQNWPDGSGPNFTVTADYTRTLPPPPPGLLPPPQPKSAPDCGDNVVEPCTAQPPPPSTHPFPVNVVVDAVNMLLWQTFEDPGTTCNPNDCAIGTSFNPFGPSHLVMPCPPGIDGVYVVFIRTDLDAPNAPLGGHVWTY